MILQLLHRMHHTEGRSVWVEPLDLVARSSNHLLDLAANAGRDQLEVRQPIALAEARVGADVSGNRVRPLTQPAQ